MIDVPEYVGCVRTCECVYVRIALCSSEEFNIHFISYFVSIFILILDFILIRIVICFICFQFVMIGVLICILLRQS